LSRHVIDSIDAGGLHLFEKASRRVSIFVFKKDSFLLATIRYLFKPVNHLGQFVADYNPGTWFWFYRQERTDRKNKASFLPPRRRRVALAPRSTTAGRAP
jgi:hypothetical protein